MARKDAPRTPADQQPPPPKAKCSTCVADAEMSEIIDGERRNTCFKCRDRRRDEESRKKCAEMGITTKEQAWEWLRKNQLLVRRVPEPRQREPGED